MEIERENPPKLGPPQLSLPVSVGPQWPHHYKGKEKSIGQVIMWNKPKVY